MAALIRTRSIMTMTKAEAQRIQAEQIKFYGQSYGGTDRVRALVMAKDTSHLLSDGVHDVATINRHIPRGVAIEWLIPEKREQMEQR